MFKKIIIGVMLIVLGVVFGGSSWAAVSHYINFQGKVDPKPTTNTVKVTFTVQAKVDATLISEKTYTDVAGKNNTQTGVINAKIGPITDSDALALFGFGVNTLITKVKVESTDPTKPYSAEINPNQALDSVPTAFHAQVADSLAASVGGDPVSVSSDFNVGGNLNVENDLNVKGASTLGLSAPAGASWSPKPTYVAGPLTAFDKARITGPLIVGPHHSPWTAEEVNDWKRIGPNYSEAQFWADHSTLANKRGRGTGTTGGGTTTNPPDWFRSAIDTTIERINTVDARIPANIATKADIPPLPTTWAWGQISGKPDVALKGDIPVTTDFARKADIPDVTNFANKTTDLAGFAKTTDLANYANKTTDLAGFAKTTDLAGFAKTTDLVGVAKTTDLAGFAKTTDLADYAKTTDLGSTNNNVSTLNTTVTGLNTTVTGLAGKFDTGTGTVKISAMPKFTSFNQMMTVAGSVADLPANPQGGEMAFVPVSFTAGSAVNGAAAGQIFSSGAYNYIQGRSWHKIGTEDFVDINGNVLETKIPTTVARTSSLKALAYKDALIETDIPVGIARQNAVDTLTTTVNGKANATDLANKADKSALDTLTTTVGTKANVADVYTRTAVDTALGNKANASDLTALTTTVGNKANVADVYTKTAVNTALGTKANASDLTALTTTVGNKANASDLTALTTTVNGKADTTTVNTALGTKANATDVYTKTAVDTALNNIDAGKITTGTFGSARIAAGAIGASQLAANAVGTTQLAAGAVGTTQLAANAVNATKLAAGSVGTVQLAANAVDATKLADGAITTTKLADGAITDVKIGAVSAAKLTGALPATVLTSSNLVKTSDLDTALTNYATIDKLPTISTTGKLVYTIGGATTTYVQWLQNTTTGNIGIGTNDPKEPFEFSSTSGRTVVDDGQGDNRRGLLLVSPTTGSDYGRIEAYGYGASGGGKPLVFNTVGGANVAVGTTNPGAKFHVSGAESSTHGKNAAVEISNTASGGANWYLRVGATGTATPAGSFGIADDNGYRLSVNSAGNILQVSGPALATAWNLSSDLRLKTNLVKITGALDKIDQLNGYYFNWKEGTDKATHVGVVAQEVEKVLPEIVSQDSAGIKAVDYGQLTPLLIEAIKDLKAQNEALKARIDNLEKKLGGAK